MSKLTEKAIKESFLKLLNERPLASITVKDIVADCGLNRNTFYYHYNNIPEVIEAIIKEQIDELGLSDKNLKFESLDQCIERCVSFILTNKKATYHIYKSVSRDIFERYLREMCEYAISSYFDTVFAEVDINNSDRELIIKYYECMCFGAMILWLEDGMTQDIVAEFKRIFELKQGHMEQMVKRSVEGRYWNL